MTSGLNFSRRVGVWWTSDTWPIRDVQDKAREIEALGYGSLFFGEALGKEALTQAAALLAATDRLVVGTGIANIHARDPIAAEAGARTLTAVYPGRFVLGLGISHGPLVEHRGGTYRKPLATTREYLQRMSELAENVEPGARPTRLLAALGPKMVELSGTAADGAHPYLVTPEHTRQTREILDRVGERKWLVPEQAGALTTDRETGLRAARVHLNRYLQLPNYRNSWLRLGFDESDFAGGGSQRLVDAMVAIGDAPAVAERLRAHLDAGADHVLVQVRGESDDADPLPALRELAPALDAL